MLTITHPPINGTVSAVGHEGITATTADGHPARLAIIDADGNVIDDSPGVAAAAWNVAIECHRNFLVGKGHLRALAKPAADGREAA